MVIIISSLDYFQRFGKSFRQKAWKMFVGIDVLTWTSGEVQVDDLEAICPDEKRNEVQFLRSETSHVVLPYLEDLLIKALEHEHR